MSERKELLTPLEAKNTSSFKEVGKRLKSAREAQNLSLDDIIGKTRINQSILTQIEEGRIEDHPGPVFLRGFVRSYAEVVGLDPEEIVQSSGLEKEQISQEQQLYLNELANTSTTKRKISLAKILMIIAILGGLTYTAWSLLTEPKSNEQSQQSQIENTPNTNKVVTAKAKIVTSQKAVIDEEKTTASQNEIILPENNTAITNKTHSLVIDSRQTVWLRIQKDNEPPFETKMLPGEQLNIQAKQGFKITAGNRSAIRVFFNGNLITYPEKNDLIIDWNITTNTQ